MPGNAAPSKTAMAGCASTCPGKQISQTTPKGTSGTWPCSVTIHRENASATDPPPGSCSTKSTNQVRHLKCESSDCFRGKVALELEWNNKDPFYDRNLNNFRLLYDLRIADVGVLITRSTGLQKWLYANHGMLGKAQGTYGSSTTHFDKLEPRILGGGAGGCPVFVFAMTEQLYFDDR